MIQESREKEGAAVRNKAVQRKAGMAQGVSDGSIASLTATGSFVAGDTLTITDAQGAEMYAVRLEKQAAHLVLASEKLQSGSAYTLNVNGSEVGTAAAK